jgi:hypothetical protein
VVRSSRDALKKAAEWAAKGRRPLAIALVGALAGWGLYAGNQVFVAKTSRTPCPAGCVTDGTRNVSSDPTTQDLEKKIVTLNEGAKAGAYYSVVLLDPFTYSTSGTISQSRMTDELGGAYLALKAVDAPAAVKQAGLAIQLLLANEGTSAEEGESEAVAQIENLQGPDRIVAVAGMGLSTANTETAASALSQVSMPMFGAVTTGNQFNSLFYPGFFQIAPDVNAQVQALVTRLDLAAPQPIGLISSDQKTDIYSTDLNSDFTDALGYAPGHAAPLGEFSYDPATAEQQFATDATTICTSQRSKYGRQAKATPLTVLYAGREATLPALVGQFQQASDCVGLTVTIVTGSDSNALPASVTVPRSKVTVVYSDIEHVAHLSQDFVTGPPPPPAPPSTSPCLNQEYDPWEVATYDSVMAAAVTVSQAQKAQAQAQAASGSRTPSPTASPTGPLTADKVESQAVDMEDTTQYRGPDGESFGFSPNGELHASAIPVYRDENGTCRSS